MDTRSFHQAIVTPSGTPLGGWVDVSVSDNGDYSVHFHMHCSSSLASFDFAVRAYLSAPGFPTMAFLHTGSVSGVDSDDHEEGGHNPLLALYWPQLIANPTFFAGKDYKWSGAIGTVADLFDDLVEAVAGAAGFALGVIIGATSEAIGWLGATLGPGGTIGVVAGVVVFAVAAASGVGIIGAVILAVVAGVAIGAVTDALIKSRSLNDAEKAFARQVFGDSVPLDDTIITNLGGASGRGFTAKGVDGKIYVNLGKAFDNPLGPAGDAYPHPGQLLIHELTHAWQISHTGFIPGLMCSMLVNQAEFTLGDNVYDYGPPGSKWADLNAEQQGAIVDQWFGASKHSLGYQSMDQQNIYYRYIFNDLLAGNPSATSPGNLRSSSVSPLIVTSRQPDQLDVFWGSGDASLQTQWWNAAPRGGWADHPPSAITTAHAAQPDTPVAAVSRTPNHIDIFCVGPDGSIVTQFWDGGSMWNHPAFPITGSGVTRVDSGVVAVARTPQHLDVFWVSAEGAVITHWADDAPISGWFDHSPFPITAEGAVQAGSGLAVVSRLPNHLDIFWVGPEGAVWTMWWDGAAPDGNWSGHQPFPVTAPGMAHIGSPVVAVARIPQHIDVFWIGPDGAIMTQWWDANPHMGWGDHPPFALTAPAAANPAAGLAAVARTPLHLDLFWIAPDGTVMTHFWDAGPPMRWAENAFPISKPHAARAGSPVTAVARAPLHLDVFWVTPDGAIGTNWWDAGPHMGWADHTTFAITAPGAIHRDPAEALAAANHLLASSAQAANDGHLDLAAALALQAVQILERSEPPSDSPAADQRLDYLIALAEGRHNLIARLIANQQVEQAAGLAGQAVADYRTYAAEPGADAMRAARDLGALSAELAAAGRPGEAVQAQQALVEVLAGFSPAADQRLDYLIALAEGRHNLIARLIADQQVEQAAGLAGQAVADYRTYAAEPGADAMRAARDLGALSAELAAAGLTTESVKAQQALNEIRGG
jgi:hypothetical protein